SHHTLVELLDPFLALSLECQCPAVQRSTVCHPMRKSLLLRETDGGFGASLGATHLATELMKHGSRNEGNTEAKGVCNLLRQGHRLVTLHQPLIRIAKYPQCPSSITMTHHPRVFPIEERSGTV